MALRLCGRPAVHVSVVWVCTCSPYRQMSTVANRAMRSTQKFLRHAIELRSEFFHCCIFAGNFTSLSTVQSYLCGD